VEPEARKSQRAWEQEAGNMQAFVRRRTVGGFVIAVGLVLAAGLAAAPSYAPPRTAERRGK